MIPDIAETEGLTREHVARETLRISSELGDAIRIGLQRKDAAARIYLEHVPDEAVENLLRELHTRGWGDRIVFRTKACAAAPLFYLGFVAHDARPWIAVDLRGFGWETA